MSVPNPSDSAQASSRAAQAASWAFSARITAFCCSVRMSWASPNSRSRVSIVEDTKALPAPHQPLLCTSILQQLKKSDGIEIPVMLHVLSCAANLQVTKALREDRHMDFNTGSSGGRADDESRPLYGGETGGPAGGPPRGPAGSPGGEFNLQDPVGSFVSTARAVLLNPTS